MKKYLVTATVIAMNLAVTLPVRAETINLCTGGDLAGGLCKLTVGGVISTGIQAVLGIALILAFIFLVIGGIKWILSGGDKAGTEAAKGTITAALIGLVVVFLAWAFLNLAQNFLLGGSQQAFEIPSASGK